MAVPLIQEINIDAEMIRDRSPFPTDVVRINMTDKDGKVAIFLGSLRISQKGMPELYITTKSKELEVVSEVLIHGHFQE